MTERQIAADDVRLGDRIRVTFEGTVVDREKGDTHPRLALESGEDVVWYSTATVTLLDRPLPPIPTDEGTVIRRKTPVLGGGSRIRYRSNERWRTVEGGPHPAAWVPTRADYDVLVPEQTGDDT